MVTRTSKKPATRKTTAPPRMPSFAPPKGYKTLPLGTGDFGTTHDWEAENVLEGVVVEVKNVEIKDGRKTKTTRVMTINTDNGVKSVWEATKLRALFDEPPIGKKVYIQFMGIIPIKGRKNGMKDFAVAIGGK